MHNTKNCFIKTDNNLIATVGVKNLIIISHKNNIFVCSKDQSQQIKQIVNKLKKDNKYDT